MALWTPALLTSSVCAAWHRPFDGASVTYDADGISQVADLSGNNRHFTQPTVASRPDYIDGAIGFSDVAHFMLMSNRLQTTQHIFIVLETADTPYVVFAGSQSEFGLTGESGGVNSPHASFGSPSYALDGTAVTWSTRNEVYSALNNRTSLVDISGATPSWPAFKLSGYDPVGYPQYSFIGKIKEQVILDGSATTENIQYVQGYLAWQHGIQAQLDASHPYYSAAPTFEQAIFTLTLSQPRRNLPVVTLTLSQPRGAAVTRSLSQPRRSMPATTMMLHQWRRDLRLASLTLHQPRKDCRVVKARISQPRRGPACPVLILSQPRVVADHSVALSLSQPRIASVNAGATTLSLSQPRATWTNELIRQLVTVTATAAGRRLDFNYLRITADINDGFISAVIRFPDKFQYAQLTVGDEVIITESVEGLFTETTVLQIESLINPEEVGVIDHELIAISPTIILDDELLTENFGSGTAEELSVDLVDRYNKTLEWRGEENWPFQTGDLTANNESVYSVLVREAQASGAFLQSHPEGETIILMPEYAVDTDKWSTCSVDFEINDSDHIIRISEILDERDGYNIFVISGQSTDAGNYRLDDIEISAAIKEFKGYIIPWATRYGVFLDHKGGDWVTIDYLGEYEEVVTDVDVVIESGYGRLSLPCYSLVSWRYKEDGLGNISIENEDGSIKTEQIGDALLDIKYKTRYRKWRSNDPKAESVLYFLDRI